MVLYAVAAVVVVLMLELPEGDTYEKGFFFFFFFSFFASVFSKTKSKNRLFGENNRSESR